MNLFEFFARRRRRPRSRGQSLVEFALILPLLMVFLATVLDLGRIYYANISLLNAAREGAFQASKTPGSYLDGQPCNTATNLVVCRVQLESKGSMVEVDEADIDVTCSKSGCPLEANSTVTVHVAGRVPADHADPRVHLRRPDDRPQHGCDTADRVLPCRRRLDAAADARRGVHRE